MASDLRSLIKKLGIINFKICENNFLNETNYIKEITNLTEEFNKRNLNTFKFGDFVEEEKLTKDFAEILKKFLENSWLFINKAIENHGAISTNESDEQILNLNIDLISSCLDTIRLVSRDTSTVILFEHKDLLNLVQKFANLSYKENSKGLTNLNNSRIQSINLSALKSMSNLIYNSKYVQEFYVNNGVAEAVSISLKQFSFDDVFEKVSLKNSSRLNIMIFNLRILFLLTVFDKELRLRLREKLQVITYLIEIIDLIMKERLQINDFDSSIDTNELSDFCYLKMIDLDFINEILKILYNLTMDTAKPNLNFSTCSSNNHEFFNEEEEAHLMHLVSVLRDLMTCRLEQDPHSSLNKNLEKLNELHSNIINLLTNMPSICFEELMTPCANQSPKKTTYSEKFYIHFNVRLAHNKQRQTRRSKRLKQNQDKIQSSNNNKKFRENIENDQFFFINNEEDLEFEGKNIEAIAMILSFMNYQVNNYLDKQTSENADQTYPVLLLLSLMSKSNKVIRHYCKIKVLPPLKKSDLLSLPQNGSHIRNRLVHLMTDANLQVKRLSAQFLFILCKESIHRLIKYTGYGNAAGLLAEAGLMLSTHGDRSAYSSDSEESDTEDYNQLKDCINQITGKAEIEEAYMDETSKKYIKANKKDIFEGLSDEQKEYEALQLVNVIDKLTRIGSGIKPATIGPNGKPVEIGHVLQLQDNVLKENFKYNDKN